RGALQQETRAGREENSPARPARDAWTAEAQIQSADPSSIPFRALEEPDASHRRVEAEPSWIEPIRPAPARYQVRLLPFKRCCSLLAMRCCTRIVGHSAQRRGHPCQIHRRKRPQQMTAVQCPEMKRKRKVIHQPCPQRRVDRECGRLRNRQL